ncbi:MAG: nitroreductase family protein [Muribaculaceae bacterium]|nr:nitroreductase family protein [Muribaculaceae bacterium]
MDIIQAMKERRSVRSFNGEPLSSEIIHDLQKIINESYTLFGGKVTIRLKYFDLKGDFKPSTYGVIKGASDYFLMAIGEGEDSALTAGFQFEQIVLKAWEMGLGTCWIAGTYKGSQFDQGENWPEGESLKIICPVGFPEKQRVFEKMMRFTVGSDKRKPFSELFFEDDFKKSLNPENKFGESLEMLRIAPSSTNSQPWRILVKGDEVLFYYKSKGPISILDTGIGICHFYETEKYNGFGGKFVKSTDFPVPPEDWRYLVTYIREKK